MCPYLPRWLHILLEFIFFPLYEYTCRAGCCGMGSNIWNSVLFSGGTNFLGWFMCFLLMDMGSNPIPFMFLDIFSTSNILSNISDPLLNIHIYFVMFSSLEFNIATSSSRSVMVVACFTFSCRRPFIIFLCFFHFHASFLSLGEKKSVISS